VLFRVGSADDFDIFGRAMGLTPHHTQFCKTSLDIGMQAIKMGFGWLEPFLNISPNIDIPEDVSDSEVHQSAQELLSLVPKPKSSNLLLPQSVSHEPTLTQEDTLTADEDALLKQITVNPDIVSATDHYRMASLSTKRGGVAKQGLIQKKKIKETPVESGRRGRAKLFLEAIDTGATGSIGGALHNHIRNKAENWHKNQGCITGCEECININGRNRFVDIAVTWPDGSTEAIEVETGNIERAIENIKKNLSTYFDRISVLTPNKKIRESIKNKARREINSPDLNRLKFPSLDRYESN